MVDNTENQEFHLDMVETVESQDVKPDLVEPIIKVKKPRVVQVPIVDEPEEVQQSENDITQLIEVSYGKMLNQSQHRKQ